MSKNIFKTKKSKFFAIFCLCFIACLAYFKITYAGMEEFMVITVGTFLSLIATFLGWVIGVAGAILDWTLNPSTFGLIKNNAIINIGWTVIRDLVNMIFIVILLIVAFAKVLGISKYQDADKVIIRLVIAALLINFSKVLCGFLIDASSVLTAFFVKGGAAGGSTGENLANALSIQNLFASGITINGGKEISGTLIITTLAFTNFILLIAAAAFLMLALMLVVRMVYLWILVMISPLAWAGFITGDNLNLKVFEDKGWWDSFVGYLLQAPTAAFFLYIAIRIAGTKNLAGMLGASLPTGGGLWSLFSNSLNMIIQYAIVITLMILGYKSAKASGEIVTKYAGGHIEGAKSKVLDWGKRLGVGAVVGGAGYTAAKLAETKKGKWGIEKLQTMRKDAETIPGIGRMIGGPGAYRQKQAEKYEKAKKGISSLTADELLATIDQSPIGEEGLQRRAAAIAMLAEKDPDKLTDSHQELIQKLQGVEIGADLSKSITATRPDWENIFKNPIGLPKTLAKIKASKLENVSAKILDPANPRAGVVEAAIIEVLKNGQWTSNHLKNIAKSDNAELTAHLRRILNNFRNTILNVPARSSTVPDELKNYLNSLDGRVTFP